MHDSILEKVSGSQIIDDYADAHLSAHQDPFVLQTWKETRWLQKELKALISRLPADSGRPRSEMVAVPANFGRRFGRDDGALQSLEA